MQALRSPSSLLAPTAFRGESSVLGSPRTHSEPRFNFKSGWPGNHRIRKFQQILSALLQSASGAVQCKATGSVGGQKRHILTHAFIHWLQITHQCPLTVLWEIGAMFLSAQAYLPFTTAFSPLADSRNKRSFLNSRNKPVR